jgi:hypothetical protein
MSFFGWVIRNGQLSFSGNPVAFADGTASAPSITFASDQTKGFVKTATGIGVAGFGGLSVELVGGSAGTIGLSSAASIGWESGTIGTAQDTIIKRIGPNRLQLFDGSTTAGTIRLGVPEFSQAASTFAQTATITNGPRAANPVTWLEVSYANGASTGRIPIW